ncbi:MAG: hypothetical protein R6W70_11315, partial [bacterium]
DSDGDTIPDSEEAGEDPENPRNSDTDDTPDYLDLDSDNDGLPDKSEKDMGTDPTKKDTDGDGSDDLAEIAYGSDPTDAEDTIPKGIFYVVLPYNALEPVNRELEFSTKIESIDVLIMFDESGSMGAEADNLKEGVKNTVIDGISQQYDSTDYAYFGFTPLPYEMRQPITEDTQAVKDAVDGIDTGGGDEMMTMALYLAASGEGYTGQIKDCTEGPFGGVNCNMPGGVNVDVAPMDCSSEVGSVGGACFRKESMPIFIMLTDEPFDYRACVGPEEEPESGTECKYANVPGPDLDESITRMNGIGAKFIGIDSYCKCTYDENYNPIDCTIADAAKEDFTKVATMTGSIAKNGDPFIYHTENCDGTGLSDQIVDAVAELTTYIDMDVTTGKMAEEDQKCEGTSAAEFIKSATTVAADPTDGVSGSDDTTFFSVTQGTTVTFDVEFENDFCRNNTQEAQVYKAKVTVLGNESFLSSRLVHVVVPPGKMR